jgi:hypothetical protein
LTGYVWLVIITLWTDGINTAYDIQDKLEPLYDPQARRLLYAELKKAKHERNGSHRLLTSTSKRLKLLRSEKNNLLYAKLMYSHMALGSYSALIFIFTSRTQRILLIMSHCLLFLPLTSIQPTKTAQSSSTSKSYMMDCSTIGRTLIRGHRLCAVTQATTIKTTSQRWDSHIKLLNYFQCLDSTGSHPKKHTDEIQHAITMAAPLQRRDAIGLPLNKWPTIPGSPNAAGAE